MSLNSFTSFEEYHSFFLKYFLNINMIYLINRITCEEFEQYPTNIPNKIVLKTLPKIFSTYINIRLRENSIEEDEIQKILDAFPSELNEEKRDDLVNILSNIFSLKMLLYKYEPNENITFEIFTKYQEFLMSYSLFEGFILESLKYACLEKPQMISKKIVLNIHEVLRNENYNDLIKLFVDKFVAHEGYGGLDDRIKALNDLNITNVGKKDIKKLSKLGLVRNVIVHNGGKVNEHFAKNLDKKQLLNSYITLDNEELDEYIELIEKLSYKIYSDIAINIFKINKNNIPAFTDDRIIH